MKSKIDYSLFLPKVIEIIKKAGHEILDVYGWEDYRIKEKQDKTPITEADRRSHSMIKEELTSVRINHGQIKPLPFLSEEGENIPFDERRQWDYYWLVDPLDGTKEFIKKNGEFTVNIALMKRDMPLFGMVFAPVLDVLYFGGKGLGPYRLEKLLKQKNVNSFKLILNQSIRLVPQYSERDTIRVIGSRSHINEAFTEYVTRLKDQYRQVELLTSGSALKFCRIAEGKADIYPRLGRTMEWDTAAGHALVNSAGKRVYLYHNRKNELSYNKKELVNPWFICR
jgi:3'(2'), 5'-bisphosphate nucleotidase